MKHVLLVAGLLAAHFCTGASVEDQLHIESNSPLRYALEIEFQARKELIGKISAVTYALDNEIETPIPPARMSKERVWAEVEAGAEAVVDKEFPRTFGDTIREEAQKKYEIWNTGDTVKIRFQHLGRQTVREGILDAKATNRVIVSSLPIARRDIDREHLARLYIADHEQAIQRYIRKATDKFDRERTERLSEERKALADKLFRKYGYRRHGDKWADRKGIFDQEYRAAWAALHDESYPQFKRTIYEANGGVYDEINDEWTFPDASEAKEIVEIRPTQRPEARSLLQRFRQLFLGEEADVSDLSEQPEEAGSTGFTEDDIWESDIEKGLGAEAEIEKSALDEENSGSVEAPPQPQRPGGPPPVQPVDDLYDED